MRRAKAKCINIMMDAPSKKENFPFKIVCVSAFGGGEVHESKLAPEEPNKCQKP